MNDVRRKVAALVNAKEAMAIEVLVELIIDTVARGLGRLGGRPKVAPKAVDETNQAENHEEKPVTESCEPVRVSAQPLSMGGKGGSGSDLCLFPPETGSGLEGSSGDRESDEREPAGFAEFWEAYPNVPGRGRPGRARAARAWKRWKPPLAKVLEALAWQRQSADWVKDNGTFIPHPASWLNAGGWKTDRPVDLVPMRPAPARLSPAHQRDQDTMDIIAAGVALTNGGRRA